MKRKIPLELLELFQPHIDKNKDSIIEVKNPEVVFHVIDKNEESTFFFKIIKQDAQNSRTGYILEFFPRNKQDVSIYKVWVELNQITTAFDSWLALIKIYDSIHTIYDDPIIEAYTKEYYTEFEIVDEDSDTKPFSIKQILLLDEHLENIENEIEKFQTEENKEEIKEIKNEVINLRENLTKKSKKWVIKNLSKTWAKITKQGPKFIKEFLSEVKKEAIKEGVKILLEGGINHLK